MGEEQYLKIEPTMAVLCIGKNRFSSHTVVVFVYGLIYRVRVLRLARE